MASSRNLITKKRTKDNAEKPEDKGAPEAQDDEATRALKIELAQAKAALKKAQTGGGSSIKVSAKGCVSVYGLGRFPVSFYKSQWVKLFAMREAIEDFIAENAEYLPEKKKKATPKAAKA